ncbi:MAG TPA: hypothetical protein VFZ25_11465 [Chloroflexota bacterium]|nr:hypothetical protein [Chloroflexota bacterium]
MTAGTLILVVALTVVFAGSGLLIVLSLRSDDPRYDPKLRGLRILSYVVALLMCLSLAFIGIVGYVSKLPTPNDMIVLSGNVDDAHEQQIGRSTDFVIEVDGQVMSVSQGNPRYATVREAVSRGDPVRVWIQKIDYGKGSVVNIWQLQKDDQTLLSYDEMVGYERNIASYGLVMGLLAVAFAVYMAKLTARELGLQSRNPWSNKFHLD